MTKKLLMGNEAFAHAALEAGVRVAAGYPGTPSSELIETVAKLHASGAARGVHVEWSTNEKSALELLAGASYAGARCLFTCKQVGLNVASDPLMSLNYVGVKGGLVLFVADDPGPISSQTEQDTRRFAAFAKMPVLDPSTPDEGFAMMHAAFDLSERYRTPVIVRPTTRINHASTFFDVADATDARPVPPEGFERDPKWIIFPRRAYEAHGEINERLRAIAHDFHAEPALAVFNPMMEHGAAPRLGIVAGGVSAAYAREALRMLEERGVELPAYRFWQVGTPYPFPEETAARFAEGLDQVLVLEELDHVLEDELLRFAGRTHAALEVRGRLTGDARDRGENDVDDIAARIASFLGVPGAVPDASAAAACDEPLPVRPPVLCAGCPHRGSFYAVKRALGKVPAVLCGDIGCYTLGNAKPLDAVDTCLCMGAGITMAQGFAVAEPGKKHVAFVGDSTFFASGLPGIVNAVYNGHDVTVCVLDNATTAMTGSQPHPGTGVTLMGPRRAPVSIERVLQAVGFECIVHADPLDLDASVAAATEALAFEGPSAILFESPCVQLVRPGAPAAVDADACTGCKKCITEIGCPGIGFDGDARGPKSGERGQAFVDASLCNGCGLCVQVCPFDALRVPSACQPTDAVDAAASRSTRPRRADEGSRTEVRHASASPSISGTAETLADVGGPGASDESAAEGDTHA
ncbi:indolepyruvate ferredoxin oxidoreductase subunit alpha [Gordonibacter urolithinfaciens]|uniref:indolepyruvate ferredoxin oxidoreductase subunit alpha n=1 Tax=Gordonibacter urolithinfaciens TaxID=1335613 RepID=UPI001F4E5F1A|nr:indolepyruvate ferredoxin oxidoreductase subunit alpha [Gordonibacter urolithinfaciens]GKG89003.1 indolepyruvate ferredoxin oxidoreductase subunit alpha [Gordonibacter pamelaeae]